MTHFIWQSLLLLALAYLVGAWLGCTLRQIYGTVPARRPLTAPAAATAPRYSQPEPAPQRAYEPYQPASPRVSAEPPRFDAPPLAAGGAAAGAAMAASAAARQHLSEPVVEQPIVEQPAFQAPAWEPSGGDQAIATPPMPDLDMTDVDMPVLATAPVVDEAPPMADLDSARIAAPSLPVIEGPVGTPAALDGPPQADVLVEQPGVVAILGSGAAAAAVVVAEEPASDDLTRIRAIDPALAAKLNERGVRRYADIVALKALDVRNLDAYLGLNGRISREGWIEQAKVLADGQLTEYARRRDRGEISATLPGVSGEPWWQQGATGVRTEGPVSLLAGTAATTALHADTGDTAARQAAADQSAERGLADAPSAGLGLEDGDADDLKRIRAIDVATEAALNRAGIMQFRQIAGWTADDVVRFDRELTLNGRVSRENWIAQAQALAGSREGGGGAGAGSSDGAMGGAGAIGGALGAMGLGGAAVARAVMGDSPTDDTAADRGHDDLKRIRGIGRKIEEQLNAAGVTRYRQIAAWTSADVDRVNNLVGFSGRVERENWIEQARILEAGGLTEFARRVDRGEVETSAPVGLGLVGSAPTAAQSVGATDAPKSDGEPGSPWWMAAASAAVATGAAATAATITGAAATLKTAAAVVGGEALAKDTDAASDLGTEAGAREGTVFVSTANRGRRMVGADRDEGAGLMIDQPEKPRPIHRPKIVAARPDQLADLPDDLKRIKGIGVVVERRLQGLGITRYDQIAEWTDADLKQVDHALGIRGQVLRQNWVEQAKILSEGGQTEFSRRFDRGEVEPDRET